MTTRIKIGSKEYDVPELNFVALERAWPYVAEVIIQRDFMEALKGSICIIAAGLCEVENFDPSIYGFKKEDLDNALDLSDQIFEKVVLYIKKNLKANQIADLSLAVNQIIKDNGLEPESGEAPAAEETSSMETGAPSSQNLSQPDAREEVGKA